MDRLVLMENFQQIVHFLHLLIDILPNGTLVSLQLIFEFINLQQILLFVLRMKVLGIGKEFGQFLAFGLRGFEIGVILPRNDILEFFFFSHG